METRSHGLDFIKHRSRRLFILLIAFAVILVASLNAPWAFGDGGFELVESYPKNEADNAAIENLGIKLTFSTPITEKGNREINDNCFSITDTNGKPLDIKVYYNPKDDHQILVLYDITKGGQLTSKGSETFKVKISGDLTDDAGNVLGDDVTITFSTINQARSTRIYLVMMLLMMAGMGVYTSMQARKKMAEEAATATVKDETFNPYKEAKRTGKSVAEVLAEHEKEVAKKEAQAAKEAKRKARFYEQEEEEEVIENTNYKVKGPRPISAIGSSYKPPAREVASEPEPAKKNKKKKK